jgi:hypothetical protein
MPRIRSKIGLLFFAGVLFIFPAAINAVIRLKLEWYV